MDSFFNSDRQRKMGNIAGFLAISAVIVMILVISSFLRVRVDLTEDNRYTLSGPTKQILADLDDRILIQVFLDGDMPIGFKKLKRSVDDLLNEFRVYSGRKIDYEFINPVAIKDPKARASFQEELAARGLNPINVQAGDEEGGTSQKIIFPGLTINHNGAEVPVNFLKNNPAMSAEQNLSNSIEGLEYELIKTIHTLTSDTIKRVAFIEGHGEYSEVETGDIMLELAKYFNVDRGVIQGRLGVLDSYAAIIIAGPRDLFPESDKLVIDQYLMKGGRVVWLVDAVDVNTDSLALGSTVAFYRELGIEDMLFNYGFRLNPVLIQDNQCLIIPVKAMSANAQSQYIPVPWIYYPLLEPAGSNPVTKNINRVRTNFAGYIDTVGTDNSVRKTVLLSTTGPSRVVTPPTLIKLDEFRRMPPESAFSRSALPVAVLAQGKFQSLYRNRLTSHLTDSDDEILKESKESAILVVADADVIRNDVRRVGGELVPLDLSLDRYTMQMFGNKDFLVNAINYITDDRGLVELRGREIKLRLTDRNKVKSKKFTLQLINTLGPVLVVILAGFFFNLYRRYRYGS